MDESSFQDAIAYSPTVLSCFHLTLKEEQLLSAKALYEGMDAFVWLLMRFGKSLCCQILPFVFDHNLGLIGSGTSSILVVVCALIFLRVDQIQRS